MTTAESISFAGTILEPHAPPGFAEDGRRVIAEFPEFRMIEQWAPEPYENTFTVELSEELEAARWRGLFRIIDKTCDGTKRKAGAATTPEERMAWAFSLVRLAAFTQSCGPDLDDPALGKAGPLQFPALHGTGGYATAARLAHTIGRRLTAFENSGDIEDAINDAAAAFKNALRAYAAASGFLHDRRATWKISRETVLIQEAVSEFTLTRKRPDKETLRQRIESAGMRFAGKDQAGKWEDCFSKAGLGKLPASPSSWE